jgi:hypothetical protein
MLAPRRLSMTDAAYLAIGLVVFGVFGAFAIFLKRV